jgi:hypothetical protein
MTNIEIIFYAVTVIKPDTPRPSLYTTIPTVKLSPAEEKEEDLSFEAYKQKQTPRRSFSPFTKKYPVTTPDISPIELNKTFRLSPMKKKSPQSFDNTPLTVLSKKKSIKVEDM